MKKIVIGYGTGRCGTKSLASFLKQNGMNISHEGYTKYAGGLESPLSDPPLLLNDMLEKEGDWVGDVGYYWLNFLWLPMRCYPGTRAINLWRDVDEVVESFWSYKQGARDMDRRLHKWFGYPFNSDRATKKSIARTIKKYTYDELELLKAYPTLIHRMHVNDLNDTGKLEELLDWLGFDGERVLTPIHTNKREQLLARHLVPKRFPLFKDNPLEVRVFRVPFYRKAFRRIKGWLLNLVDS